MSLRTPRARLNKVEHDGVRLRALVDPESSTAVAVSSGSSGRLGVADRRDAPAVSRLGKAWKHDAVIAGASSDSRSVALANCKSDKVAASASGNACSWFATWTEFHKNWFGQLSDPIPLTCHSIAGVAAQFKAGRYRSFPNYLNVAKQRHIKEGFEWSDALSQEPVLHCDRCSGGVENPNNV